MVCTEKAQVDLREFRYIKFSRVAETGESIVGIKYYDGCGCTLNCLTSDSSHVGLNEDPVTCGCILAHSSAYTSIGRLSSTTLNSSIFECNSSCTCPSTCPNRVVQHGTRKKLMVFHTDKKGFAVKCREIVRKGEFVCSYAGDVIRTEMVEKRREMRKDQMNFIMSLKENNNR